MSNMIKDQFIKELEQVLQSHIPSVGLAHLYHNGSLDTWLPELSKLKGCPQNPVFHPEGDVWNHTMLVVDEGAKVKRHAKDPRHFMYACLLHDIGKPDTTVKDKNNRLRSNDHDTVGATLSEAIINRLLDNTDLAAYVSTLTKYHMRAHKLLEMKDYKVRKMMLDVDMHELLLLNACDISGHDLTDTTPIRLREINAKRQRIADLSVGDFGQIKPYINQSDVIAKGVSSQSAIKTLVDEAFDLQLQGCDRDAIDHVLTKRLTKS